jgi:hypothetical protein
VVAVEQEYSVSWPGGNDAAAAHSLHRVSIAPEDREEGLGVDVISLIVNLNTIVHVRAIRFVEYLTGVRVVRVLSDVVIHHHDDVLRQKSTFHEDMVRMTYVSLMPVVAPSV